MSICPTHIFVTKRRLILACTRKPFGELKALGAFGSVAERGRRSCPRMWLNVIESKRCQHLGKGTRPFLLSALVKQIQKRIKDDRQQHDGTFVKECCQMWRVEHVNIWTMTIWPIHIFVTKRRLILACMNKPFREVRYLAVSQRGRRSCPRIWLSAIEPKRTVSTSWQRY